MSEENRLDLHDATEPPWDDLRERRVLERVLDVRRGWGRLRGGSRRIGLRVAPLLLFSVLAIGAAGAGYFVWSRRSAASASASLQDAPMLRLPDGSVAALSADALVDFEEQSTDYVRLEQRAGRVSYDIRPNPSRTFVAHVGQVEMRSTGCAFTLQIQADWLTVRVQRGRLQVDDGLRQLELLPDEELRVLTQPPPAASADLSRRSGAEGGP